MLIPLKIADTLFPNNLIQAPLAGISCAPFRRLTWEYGRPAFSYTEMISCKTILGKTAISTKTRYLHIDPREGPVCFQLSGNNENELSEAVKQVTDLGANLIDLNCGCPVKKIRSKGAGSSLLMDVAKLQKLMTAMRNNTHLPVSIKIRVEGKSEEKFHKELVNAIHDSGLDFITVHGRHWTEYYETACQHEQIAYFVNELKIPVIGNGDIACIDSLKKMLATGCAGGMIGRAGVGQPWLIKKLEAEFNHAMFKLPAFEKMGEMFIQHIEELALLLENEKFAILQARKMAKYYARHIAQRNQFCLAINTCADLIDFKTICRQFFI